MGKTHTELKAFWQNRFRTEIEKAFGAKVGKEPGEALSQGDLQEIFGALDLKKNGVLDLEEIQTTFRKLGFNDKNIETLFKSADLDGSGCISFNEFRELLTTKNNNGQNDLQVEYLLKKFRTHIFDRLEQAGFERGSVDSEKLWRVFNELDVGHHGVLDLHDIRVALRRAGESEDVITKMLAALDVKHEGKISWDDFQQIMFETRKIQGQY
jgi:Ca2+-binding EF-hand superfamily protein